MINKYDKKFLQKNSYDIRSSKHYVEIAFKMYELKSFKGSYMQFIRKELKDKTNNLEHHYQSFALLEYEGCIKKQAGYLLWQSPKNWINQQSMEDFLFDNKNLYSNMVKSVNKGYKKNPDISPDELIRIILSVVGKSKRGLKIRNKEKFSEDIMDTETGKKIVMGLGLDVDSIERKSKRHIKRKIKKTIIKKQAAAERPLMKLEQQIQDDISS